MSFRVFRGPKMTFSTASWRRRRDLLIETIGQTTKAPQEQHGRWVPGTCRSDGSDDKIYQPAAPTALNQVFQPAVNLNPEMKSPRKTPKAIRLTHGVNDPICASLGLFAPFGCFVDLLFPFIGLGKKHAERDFSDALQDPFHEGPKGARGSWRGMSGRRFF